MNSAGTLLMTDYDDGADYCSRIDGHSDLGARNLAVGTYALKVSSEFNAHLIPRYVLAVDPPTDNPHAIGVLAGCDAVLLLLQLGTSTIPHTRRNIELIGSGQIVGAVLVGD